MHFGAGKEGSLGKLAGRQKGVREIGKSTQEALQEGSLGNWGSTALPELCTTPSLGLEEWGEGTGSWVQSFACFSV